MNPNDRPADAISAEEAINSILEEERRSREQIDRRRAQAAELVAEARNRAHRIQLRADARSVAMRNLCQREAAAHAAALRADAEAVRARPVQADAREGALAQAIAALAAELTGGGS